MPLTAEVDQRSAQGSEDRIFPEEIPASFKTRPNWEKELNPEIEDPDGLARAREEMTIIRKMLARSKPIIPEEPTRTPDAEAWKKHATASAEARETIALMKDSQQAKNNWVRAWESAKIRENDMGRKGTMGEETQADWRDTDKSTRITRRETTKSQASRT